MLLVTTFDAVYSVLRGLLPGVAADPATFTQIARKAPSFSAGIESAASELSLDAVSFLPTRCCLLKGNLLIADLLIADKPGGTPKTGSESGLEA
jgi:hypothetical protein